MKKSSHRSLVADADLAKRVAIEFCLFHYPTLYTAGVLRRKLDLWVVPVMLEDPEAGISSGVGELKIDAAAGKIVASTPVEEVVAAGRRCYQESNHARRSAPVSAAKK